MDIRWLERKLRWEGIFNLILLGAVWRHIAGCCVRHIAGCCVASYCWVLCGLWLDEVVEVSRSDNHRIWCPQENLTPQRQKIPLLFCLLWKSFYPWSCCHIIKGTRSSPCSPHVIVIECETGAVSLRCWDCSDPLLLFGCKWN